MEALPVWAKHVVTMKIARVLLVWVKLASTLKTVWASLAAEWLADARVEALFVLEMIVVKSKDMKV